MFKHIQHIPEQIRLYKSNYFVYYNHRYGSMLDSKVSVEGAAARRCGIHP